VFCPSSRNSIGKHGNFLPYKGARFYFHDNVLPLLAEEKVEPAVADRDFGPYYRCIFEPCNASIFDKPPGNKVVRMGMDHDRQASSFDSDHSIIRSSFKRSIMPDKIKYDPGKEQFPEPAGVREVGTYCLVVHHAFDDKTVRPAFEEALDSFREKNSSAHIP
jgi:hypothetical protein